MTFSKEKAEFNEKVTWNDLLSSKANSFEIGNIK